MSATEKATLEAKKEAEEAARVKNIIDYTINKKNKLYTNADGIAKKKFNRMCKFESLKDGCWNHTKKHGSCGFIHTDERSQYEEIFARFGFRMVNDTSYLTLVKKAEMASGDVKIKMERDVDAMEASLKKEARCIFVTGVDQSGNLMFDKPTREQSECRNSQNGHNHSHSGRSHGYRNHTQSSCYSTLKTDNSAW